MKTKEVIEFLETQPKDVDWVIQKKETKQGRSLAQNRTWYKLFWAISKHLGYSIQEVKIYMLSWCFWTKTLKMSREKIEVPVISNTSDLTKEQWIFFIDTIIAFAKIKNVPVEITSEEVRNLYDSYKE